MYYRSTYRVRHKNFNSRIFTFPPARNHTLHYYVCYGWCNVEIIYLAFTHDSIGFHTTRITYFRLFFDIGLSLSLFASSSWNWRKIFHFNDSCMRILMKDSMMILLFTILNTFQEVSQIAFNLLNLFIHSYQLTALLLRTQYSIRISHFQNMTCRLISREWR